MARKTSLKNNLLNAFGERYHTIECNGGYVLYDKERESKRSNEYYLGWFYLASDGKSYVFNDDYYNNVDDLVNAMDEYNKTLPFDQDIYNPSALSVLCTITLQTPVSRCHEESITSISLKTRMAMSFAKSSSTSGKTPQRESS